ncbi:hypothetical protein NBRC10512_007551 [Rhodotorula toruloides]|uniref:Patatin-like phospholipase domain-containing protein n=2 Tax=Rhodotorula toruloides TaxID=5286 RepID=A0A061B9T0_RHOTO|nr:patatin-like phospholipase domain containing protein [Rhodotorula toruloides NP11]EMS19887.1 patatin-like phospholipase domain containing protein [Rhodotorula toruloides NP11]CDR44640.1 RHTO0S09e07250g1_1 [Rhodotorula toruloides]
MEADLSRPPPAPSSSRSRPPQPSRRPTSAQTYTVTQLEQSRGKGWDKWKEWDELATDLGCDWVVEGDMEAFGKALSEPPADDQPERIIAASDWAPVKEQKRRRGPKKRKDVVREGWAYHISRWPLLMLIFTIIFLEFVGYLFVRQCVNVIEFFAGWRGERGRLRLALRNAKTYEEWKQRALALDSFLGLSHWKSSPPNAYYDSALIRRVLRSLRDLRTRDDAEGVCAVLHTCVRNNFAGVESFRLYSESYYGTKELVQEFIDEVTRSLEYIRQVPPSLLPVEEKADFFRSVAKNLGASALCLSGGASFGYYHFGVIRALLDQNLLPRVITGTSAGAIIAAFCCTRTDAELRQLITPTLADRITACEEPFRVWAKRAWKTGARFDTVQWARKASFFTMGNMTFKEAFERTGRILNVSVIPADTHSPTKLLNYLTAPDCVIYSAVIASAAVPGIINPVVLMTKGKDGKLRPHDFSQLHKDGSLRVDIPLQDLHLLYNVNFSVVSQVNPHIHLFNFASRGSPGRPVSHRRGRGWRGGWFLSAAEHYLKIEMLKWFRVIRDLELLPELGNQNWSNVFLQKFEGSVTIWPKSRIADWPRILTDPDRNELARMIRVGQQVTWPKIKMIENRLKIERQIDLGRSEVRRAFNDSDATSHSLAPPTLSRQASSGEIMTSARPRATNDRSSPEENGRGSRRNFRAVDMEASSSSGGDPVSTSNGGEETPAKRRQAILARLGLKGAAGKGSRDLYGGTVESGGEEKYTDGESDWTSGGEGTSYAGVERGSSSGKMRKRRASMSSFGRRPRRDTLSSDEDPWH